MDKIEKLLNNCKGAKYKSFEIVDFKCYDLDKSILPYLAVYNTNASCRTAWLSKEQIEEKVTIPDNWQPKPKFGQKIWINSGGKWKDLTYLHDGRDGGVICVTESPANRFEQGGSYTTGYWSTWSLTNPEEDKRRNERLEKIKELEEKLAELKLMEV